MNNNSNNFSQFTYNQSDYSDRIIKSNTFQELPFILFQDVNPKTVQMRNEMIKNITKTTECNITDVESLFFSDENIDLINKQIILSVWKRSNNQYKIGFQDKDKILIVMRYIYLEFSRNLPYKLEEQINELNCLVVGEIVPSVITNFEQKLGYLRDIEKRQDPPPLPQSTSKIKTLPTANKDFFRG
jgi:hypothetical protein